MGAALCVGRVGSLAVAVGTGLVIFTGVASADTGDASSSSSSSSSSGSASGAATSTGSTTSATASKPGTPPKVRVTDSVTVQMKVRRHTDSSDHRPSVTEGKKPADEKTGTDEKAAAENADARPAAQRKPRRSSAITEETDATVDQTDVNTKNVDENDSAPTGTVTSLSARSAATSEVTEQVSDNETPEAKDAGAADTVVTLAAPGPAASTGPFDYTPDIVVHEGVITGTNTAPKFSDWYNPLTYTVVGAPVAGGKINLDATNRNFTFLPYSADSTPNGADQFRVLVTETTWFDSALQQIPIVKYFVKPILLRLHQIPILKDVLAPLIGRSMDATVYVNIDSFAGAGQAPIAFTTTVNSFDGTPISVNWFPTIGLTSDPTDIAPTILNGPSLATAGYTDPNQETTVFGLVPGLKKIRAAGYNVVTWDPRGEYASGGILHLDSEDFEARDVSAIIDWVAKQGHTEFDPLDLLDPNSATDPRIGMLGGSYGGGIQLTSAGIDSRIDAIAPGIAWNSLETALYPNNAFKTSWASLLLLSLVVSGSRIDPEIYAGIATGVLTGFLTTGQQNFLEENSPAKVIENIKIPTLFLQGTVDGLFTLQQALDNAEGLASGTPVKMIWYCGGHGDCLDLSTEQQARQTTFLVDQQLAWMDTYVTKMQDPAPPIENKFSWIDQNGNVNSSNLLPTDDPAFYGPSITVSGAGGLLPILPVLGGSGPQRQSTFPVNITLAAPTRVALNVPIPAFTSTTYLVGAPQLTFTYSGLGTSRHIYAQIVDLNTGRTLGNLVTPIPVRLDGGTHTVTVDMENIAYTAGPPDGVSPGTRLALQIVDSATAYEDFTSFGVVNVSGVGLTLPIAANVTTQPLPPADPGTTPSAPEPQTLQDLLLSALPK